MARRGSISTTTGGAGSNGGLSRREGGGSGSGGMGVEMQFRGSLDGRVSMSDIGGIVVHM